MDARESTLFGLLDGSKHYVIPHYQRLYSWENKHCSTLFRDIENIASDSSLQHFMGSIVYVSHAAKADGINQFVVIDGQQRLTTLSLLLLAVINALGLEQDERSRRLNRTIRNGDERQGSQEFLKLRLTRSDNGSYQSIVHSVASGEPLQGDDSRIHRNYDQLRKLLEESQVPPHEIWLAISRLDMVYIALEAGKDDPQAIFESLNSTGKNLSPTDLIRNFVLMDVESERQAPLYENYWAKIEDLFRDRKDNEFEEFTRAHLAAEQEKYPRITDVYEQFKDAVRISYQRGESREQVLGKFRDSAKAYSNIHWINQSDKRTQLALEDYRSLRLKVMHPLLLRYATHGIPGKTYEAEDFISALQLLENYLIRRTFVGLKANSMDNSVAKIFSYMHKSKRFRVDSLADAFLSLRGKARFPLDEEVKYRGLTMELYNTQNKEHILRKLELKLDPSGLGTSAKLTVEHVMPQRLTKAWEQMLGANAVQVRERLVHTIGNLTLSPYNSELGNKSFVEKINNSPGGYLSSKVKLSDSIVAETTWGELEIQRRGQYLMDLAVSTWPLPEIWSDNYSQLDSNEAKEDLALVDLLREEAIMPDDELFWRRPNSGHAYIARITENGTMIVQDGEEFETPTAATKHFTSSSFNGWDQWRHLSTEGPTLNELRERVAKQQ